MKKLKQNVNGESHSSNVFDLLSEELVFAILDNLNPNPFDRKSFSMVSKSFHAIESRHRKHLKPLRTEHLSTILARYKNITHLDLTLCPRVSDASLIAISRSYSCKSAIRSINLSRSRSRFFTHVGLESLMRSCFGSLVEIDLSNGTELGDAAARAVAEAKNLEKLLLGRCKKITDIGIGCIAVGCSKLKYLSLKWCVGIGDFGVGLIAVKCKEIRSLDLSYLPITSQCLPVIMKLQHLEELVLEGCFGLDDDSLATMKLGSKTLKTLDISSCQNISHVGLSSITSDIGCLRRLNLSYGSSVNLTLSQSLRKLSALQSIKLDGCLVTCYGLESIGNWCVSLRELSLSKCTGVTDEGLSSVVKKHRDLRKLDITCCRKITYVSITDITNSCMNLTSLRMESCTMVQSESFALIGDRCRSLEELDLTDNDVDDQGLISISKCSNLSSLKLGICLDITDQGLASIGTGCPKLIELDLYRCERLTDEGIVAIATRCANLEMINVAYCNLITDTSLVSLSKCLKLHTFESRGCGLITSLGITSIASGCRQLTKLDIKKCHNIDDNGMISLAHLSQNLRQINLSYSSVTDVGLLSLASISCIQSITILHLKGLTPGGLVAALLACGGLTKVKLQTSFKLLLPQPLFEHLEARGCVFQWRNKLLQDDRDTRCWKQQLENLL